jgi:hypothetical protein
MSTTDEVAGAVADATEAVQRAATPLAFFAILGAAALAVAALVKRFGRSLPPVDYSGYFPDPAAPTPDDEDDDEEEQAREQWS